MIMLVMIMMMLMVLMILRRERVLFRSGARRVLGAFGTPGGSGGARLYNTFTFPVNDDDDDGDDGDDDDYQFGDVF